MSDKALYHFLVAMSRYGVTIQPTMFTSGTIRKVTRGMLKVSIEGDIVAIDIKNAFVSLSTSFEGDIKGTIILLVNGATVIINIDATLHP